jgi:hypothetical protein
MNIYIYHNSDEQSIYQSAFDSSSASSPAAFLAIHLPMAQRELSFIYSRAPRAAGVSEKALDEHKDLIGDLYLTQNYTRDQVITYLEEELRFKIS